MRTSFVSPFSAFLEFFQNTCFFQHDGCTFLEWTIAASSVELVEVEMEKKQRVFLERKIWIKDTVQGVRPQGMNV